MMRTLVESQFAWTGGAIHWSPEDLREANLLQLHTLRSALGLKRLSGETWVDWNSRTIRFCRVWLHNQGHPRWSEKILGLQHNLHGHWARREERLCDGRLVDSLPVRALKWRSTAWWREQQRLPASVGLRHPGRFYASNPERQLSECHGCCNWLDSARDRMHWSSSRSAYLRAWDIKWCSGRQLSLRY